MKKLLWAIPLMIAGIAFASYQVYEYSQSTTVEESIFVDDSGKISLPESVSPGEQFCGSWAVRNTSQTVRTITIQTQISEGLTGQFSIDVTPIEGSLDYNLTPNVTYPLNGCVTVKDDANGEQNVSLTISR